MISTLIRFTLLVICLVTTGCTFENQEIEDDDMHGAPPQHANSKITASQITPMIVGQSGEGNSIIQDGLEPGTYTLQFSFIGIQPRADGVSVLPSTTAIITWKVDGQQQRRVISIVSGASITGVCNAVDVKILDTPIANAGNAGLKYSVQATMSRGTRANIEQPPTLFRVNKDFFSVFLNAPITVDIPQDAGVVNLRILAAYSAGTVLQAAPSDIAAVFITSIPSIIGSYYPLITTEWVPIPAGSQSVVVGNALNTAALITLIWGVEG